MLLLDSKLSFASQLQIAITTSRQGICMIKYLSKYVLRHALNELYKLYVRPHLDYGDVIYHTPAKICEFSHDTMLKTTRSFCNKEFLQMNGKHQWSDQH